MTTDAGNTERAGAYLAMQQASMIHYAGLGDTLTTCGLACRPPTEDTHTRAWTNPVTLRLAGMASLDPRLVDCPTCVAELPEIATCACGAPALYGSRPGEHFAVCNDQLCVCCRRLFSDAQYCAACASGDCRCQRCRRPLLDAFDSFCAGCLEGDPIGDTAGDMQEVA